MECKVRVVVIDLEEQLVSADFKRAEIMLAIRIVGVAKVVEDFEGLDGPICWSVVGESGILDWFSPHPGGLGTGRVRSALPCGFPPALAMARARARPARRDWAMM
jgi:hypothetical protein